MAESASNAKTTTKGRADHLKPYHFQVGQAPPKGVGRPKGLAARIRAATNDGQDLIEGLIAIAKGTGAARDRISASQILLDRGYGRAIEQVLTGELAPEQVSEALQELTTEELRALTTLKVVK